MPIAALLVVPAQAPADHVDPPIQTTLDRTLQDEDGDFILEYGPGDDLNYVGPELCEPGACPDPTPAWSIFNFAQMTDFQLADEELTARVEPYDSILNIPGVGRIGFTSAYRPHESLQTQTINEIVRSVRDVHMPYSGETPRLVHLTGDNADNNSVKETQWYIDLLDGGVGAQIDPNSGERTGPPAGCNPNTYPTRRYQGVRGLNRWYEPDRSGPGAGGPDGPGYHPRASVNWQTARRTVQSPDWPGLLDVAQTPFAPEGLGGVPWTAVAGNHDALPQGTFMRNANPFTGGNPLLGLWPWISGWPAVALDCDKDLNGSPNDREARVEHDRGRRLLTPAQWADKHLENPDGQPYGHGFADGPPGSGYWVRNLTNFGGKYADLYMLGLYSPSDRGLHDGIIRRDQFNWLRDVLTSARPEDRFIVTAHHSLRTMNNPDVFGTGGTPEPWHCGLRDADPWPFSAANRQCAQGGQSLEELFHETDNVIAYIAGHEHRNRVFARPDPDGSGRGFWEFTTASEIDFPQQTSLFEVFVNNDGSWTIFRTLLDHAAPPDPGSDPPSGDDTRRLASIGRTLSFNDPDSSACGPERRTCPFSGGEDDRNVMVTVQQ